MNKVYLIAIIISVAGCATLSNLQPKESDITKMQQKVPGITFEEAKKGFELYKANCAGCHSLYKPADYTIAGWDKNLIEMFPKAKMNNDSVGRSQIRKYLYALSK